VGEGVSHEPAEISAIAQTARRSKGAGGEREPGPRAVSAEWRGPHRPRPEDLAAGPHSRVVRRGERRSTSLGFTNSARYPSCLDVESHSKRDRDR